MTNVGATPALVSEATEDVMEALNPGLALRGAARSQLRWTMNPYVYVAERRPARKMTHALLASSI